MAIDETKIVQKCKLCGAAQHPGRCQLPTKTTHEVITVRSWGQRNEPAIRAFVFEWKFAWKSIDSADVFDEWAASQWTRVGIYLGDNKVMAVSLAHEQPLPGIPASDIPILKDDPTDGVKSCD